MRKEVRLGSGNGVSMSMVQAGVFGEMFTLAHEAGLYDYRGDLFHDAQWLDHMFDKPGAFYWSVGAVGTSLSTSLALLNPVHDHRYRFEVTNKSYRWVLMIEKV
jgi:hypothetical protein